MKPIKAIYDYDLWPRIVPAGKGVEVNIRPMSKVLAFQEGATYRVVLLPTTEPADETGKPYPELQVRARGNALSFFWAFEGEQEYFIRLYREDVQQSWYKMTQLSVYALEPDLFSRRPYRGDFHAHSTGSDGKEDPAFVAAMYRSRGFDFMALTDHHRIEPSLEAIEAYKGVNIDLALFPGEEVHCPGNPVHIVHFGGKSSVNELFRQDEAGYLAQVAQIREELRLPEGVNPEVYARCVWASQRIREAGGLSIFCHPHWRSNVYNVSDAMSRALLERHVCDAFELVSGQTLRENTMQYALYHQLRAEGVEIPIVGSSDSHGVLDGNEFDYMKTLVFSHSLRLDDLMDAVKEGYAAPMDSYPGEQTRLIGDYRMVSYARFLLEQIYPIHDELCVEEGRLMREYQAGDEEAGAALNALSGRVAARMERYFA